MAAVKWIKICTDIFDDEKILLIENIPDGDSIIVIWFKLLCLAGKQNNSGVFMLNDKIAYTDEMLATIFRRPVNTVRLAIQTFESYGMIETVDNVITIPKWEKHQSLEKLELAKAQNRKRVAAYRERQKLLTQSESNDYCNITVIDELQKVTPTDKDIDKDIDIDNKKERKKTAKSSYDEIINEYTSNEELKQALKEFIKMRKLIKKPLTDYALSNILKKLDRIANNDDQKIAILNQSICNNWQGIFELKENTYSSGANTNNYKSDNAKEPSNYDDAANDPDYIGF